MTDGEDRRISAAIERARRIAALESNPELQRIVLAQVLAHLLSQAPEASPAPSKPLGSKSAEIARTKRSAPDNGPSVWVEALCDEGFFSRPKSIGDVVQAVVASGHHVLSKDVSFPLVRLVRMRRLRRVKSTVEGSSRKVWLYANA